MLYMFVHVCTGLYRFVHGPFRSVCAQAYSLGIPLLAPSLAMLSDVHAHTGMVSHKVAGNLPWRIPPSEKVPFRVYSDFPMRHANWRDAHPQPDAPCCANDPNDACDASAVAAWLQFADWYQWPHIGYFNTPDELHAMSRALLRNATRRHEISSAMRRYFQEERRRTLSHVARALSRAIPKTRKPS